MHVDLRLLQCLYIGREMYDFTILHWLHLQNNLQTETCDLQPKKGLSFTNLGHFGIILLNYPKLSTVPNLKGIC